METSMFCKLLLQRIDGTLFQVSGLEVNWLSGGDTPENRAIVEDVIANYDTLEAEYLAARLAEQEPEHVVLRRSSYPPMADYLDAKVKQQHSDPDIVLEGQAQEMQYYSDCLAVKVLYPKE